MATIKQQRAIEKILENPRKSISGAMREVGYSDNTAVHPKDLTESKGWKELMLQHLPDDKTYLRHAEALDATKIISARVTNKEADVDTDDFIEVPDNQTRLKAVELDYKLKGRFSPDVQINQQFNDLKIELVCDDS